jgi:hypothetical protein
VQRGGCCDWGGHVSKGGLDGCVGDGMCLKRWANDSRHINDTNDA